MISCSNIARLISQGWRLEVTQDSPRADRYHARIVHRTDRDKSHHHLGETVLQAIDSLDLYVGVVSPDRAASSAEGAPNA